MPWWSAAQAYTPNYAAGNPPRQRGYGYDWYTNQGYG